MGRFCTNYISESSETLAAAEKIVTTVAGEELDEPSVDLRDVFELIQENGLIRQEDIELIKKNGP